jgi:hypothetical protein
MHFFDVEAGVFSHFEENLYGCVSKNIYTIYRLKYMIGKTYTLELFWSFSQFLCLVVF